MKSSSRFLMLISAGLLAGATMGAGAAQAAPPTPTDGTSSLTVQAQRPDRDRVEGYYDSRRECDWAGRRGEWRDRWDDYDCDRVMWGRHRGDWMLTVSWDGRGGHDWDNNNNNNNDDDDDDDGGHGGGHGGHH